MYFVVLLIAHDENDPWLEMITVTTNEYESNHTKPSLLSGLLSGLLLYYLRMIFCRLSIKNLTNVVIKISTIK